MSAIIAQPIDSEERRRRAEELLKEKTTTAPPPGTEAELLRLHHELQVHQVELEMQNTELRQARNALETTLEKYTDLYDFAPVGYFTLDGVGTIRNANLTGAGFVGVERSRLVGRHFGHFVAEEDRPAFNTCLRNIFASPVKETCEVALWKEEMSPLCVQIEGVSATSGEECHIALIDISARKRAEEVEKEIHKAKETAVLLRIEKEAVEENARLKNQFFVNMSHELRTPMTGILGMLQFALKEDLPPVLREYLETTQSSARSLLRILNDILDMAKSEAGKLTIEEKPFSLQQCITETINIISPEVRRKGLDLAISVAEELPVMVVGDQMRLRQVIINLLGNAVKFTEEGKVMLRVTAEKKAISGKWEVTFIVTDTGIGIPNDKMELLFRPFGQIDASLSRSFGGTGLGLAISRGIVELMGGTISVVSENGVGSTFTLTLSLEEAGLEHQDLTASATFSSHAIATAGEGEMIPRLLLAEDDPVIRTVLGLLFQQYSYHLDFAEDGMQAIEMWEKGVYDLVLMDIQMPRLDGLEATRLIRKKEQELGGYTPIVAISAHSNKEVVERCLATGMDAYISKPIDFVECLQLIGDLLEKKDK